MTPVTSHRAWLAQTLVCALLSAAAAPALAQTQADLFNDSTVQDIHLTVSSRDWEALKAHADENTYYAADLRWRGVTVRNVGIRSRGAGSRNGVKPGLRVDMNRYVDQNFLGLRALVLDNAYTDPSALREVLAMKLFARAGLPAPREAYARLLVNNEYAGLYIVVEPLDRTFVARVFGDAEGNVENGGFLYEYTWVREYGFEYLGTGARAVRGDLRAPHARDRRHLAPVSAARSPYAPHQRHPARPPRAGASARSSTCRRSSASWRCSGWRARSTGSSATGA